MDMVKAAGVGVSITLSGKVYTLSPLRLRHLAEFTSWAQGKLKNPITKVMEALDSPASRERSLRGATVIRRFNAAKKAATQETERAKKANQEPEPSLVQIDPNLESEAQLALEWEQECRELKLNAYRDAYGAGPQFDDPQLAPLVRSIEGKAFELWLSLKQKHPQEFPDHWAVLDLVDENLDELYAAHQRLARLNDPDPEKNGQGRTPAEMGPATAPATAPTTAPSASA